ncbi:MAG: hypothetical protein CMJ32_01010 [Phycisphaerae bacterium]|nr:hypothetical protein [Phycisphaerae bacterium]
MASYNWSILARRIFTASRRRVDRPSASSFFPDSWMRIGRSCFRSTGGSAMPRLARSRVAMIVMVIWMVIEEASYS